MPNQNSHVDAFDRSLQKTNSWLKELGEEMGGVDRKTAYHALRAVFHALRDHLPAAEVAQLAAQLPLVLRGAYYEGWRPQIKPERLKSAEAFIDVVSEHYQNNDEVDVEDVVRCVFAVLGRHVSLGEIDDVISALPDAVKTLWFL